MKKPDQKNSELRMFGLMFGAMTVLIFGFAIPLLKHGGNIGIPLDENNLWPLWPWLVFGALSFFAMIYPASLILIYRPWMKFAQYAQWLNTRIIMLVMFYLLIFPIGVILKLLGKDSLHRKFDDKLESYRVEQKTPDKNHMEKPY